MSPKMPPSTSISLFAPILGILGLANLSLTQNTTGQNATSEIIATDTYFYGQSPPVYPSPNGTGTGDWATAYSKAAAFVANLTLEEKVNLTYGAASMTNGCAGNIPPISRVGFPGICFQDNANGVHGVDFVNAYASGIHVAASWNKRLANDQADALGGEFKTKGVNVCNGPVVGPLGRVVENGRIWEGFGPDPYLSGVLVAEAVRGIQGRGVITSVKHFIGNEQETNRNPVIQLPSNISILIQEYAAGTLDPQVIESFLGGSLSPTALSALGTSYAAESVSSNIDDKTMHELYLWPFANAIHAGSANVMCSYNRVNNSYACANSKTLNGLLKTELGFQGFVVSDWGAQHSGVATALSGLDVAMPDSSLWQNLTEAVRNGSVPEYRVTDMATRIMAAWYKLGQDSPDQPAPGVGIPVSLIVPHLIVDARNKSSKPIIFQGAIEGHVLVKNEGALPLKSPKLLSIFGYDAKAPDQLDVPSPLQLLSPWTLEYESANISAAALDFSSIVNSVNISQIAQKGTIVSGGGSGASSPAYISAPFDAFSQRAYEDDTTLLWDFVSGNPTVDGASEACFVFINAFASESYDRQGIHDEFSDSLVNKVASACNNTIVVIHNAGARLVDQFADNTNVTAIIFAHLPGQDSGRALVSLLYGDSIFSGKLPYTVAKNESDYDSLLHPTEPEGIFQHFPQSNFAEGVYIDYRAFDAKNIMPRYEFGFGLSYTNFTYGNLSISKVSTASTATYPSGPIREGGQTDLWDVIYNVKADVSNTGNYNGSEVAQLYIGIPGGPLRQLRGFEKVAIPVKQTVTVKFPLMRRDLSVWDVGAQAWKLQSGSYNIWVGASSRKLPLNGTITL